MEWGGPTTNQMYNEESEVGLFGRVWKWDHFELQFDQAVLDDGRKGGPIEPEAKTLLIGDFW